MWNLLTVISWKSLVGSVDDDWVDRMSHKWTVTLLLLCAMFISTNQNIGHPIQCWCPAEFQKWYRRYVRHYCWISNTYRLPMSEVIPLDEEARQREELSYYQWVPIILLAQAFMFKFPYIVWHLLNPTSGLNLASLCKMIDGLQTESAEDKANAIQNIAQFLNRWLLDRRNYHNTTITKIKRVLSAMFLFCFGQRRGVFLAGFYLFTKLIYLGNCVLQFWLLGQFLQLDFFKFGPHYIKCMIGECSVIEESPKFPRVTLCDFKIRQMQNLQPFTVQCVLPINLFNEKIFIITWIWIVLVGICTFFNALLWSRFMLFRSSRQEFVKKYLVKDLNNKDDIRLAKKFSDKYLRHDGCFLLRIVQKNSSDITTQELIQDLWKIYTKPVRKESYDETVPHNGITAIEENGV